MKIAVNTQYGNTDSIKIINSEIPKAAPQELLIRVMAAGLNPKDILVRKGKFKKLTGSRFPQGIGFDFAGIVEESHSTAYAAGDEVYGMLNGWKGRCCAEYVNIKEDELYNKPEGITYVEAAGIPLAAQTALQAIKNIGKLKAGEHILINGASGGVGTLAIQIAKALGGIVTTISSSKNLDFCKSLGADYIISYEETKIKDINDQYDVFFDVFGNHSYQKTKDMLTPKGVYVTTVPKPAIFREQFFNLFRKKKAKMVYVKSNKNDLKWIADKINDGKIRPIIDQVFSLEDIGLAQKHIESKRAKGKVILTING